MRAWDGFSGLDSMVKNMVTSLHAVGELQNPSIRDRHWEQLMQATKVQQYVYSEVRFIVTIQLDPLSHEGNESIVAIFRIGTLGLIGLNCLGGRNSLHLSHNYLLYHGLVMCVGQVSHVR